MDQTTWPQFLEEASFSVTETFNLNSIPAYILVDNNGVLISFECSGSRIQSFGPAIAGDELVNTLEKLLTNNDHAPSLVK